MSADQAKILEDQTKNFTDIRNQLVETRRAVSAFEEKLMDMLTWVNSAEARLDALEDAERQHCYSLLATLIDNLYIIYYYNIIYYIY